MNREPFKANTETAGQDQTSQDKIITKKVGKDGLVLGDEVKVKVLKKQTFQSITGT